MENEEIARREKGTRNLNNCTGTSNEGKGFFFAKYVRFFHNFWLDALCLAIDRGNGVRILAGISNLAFNEKRERQREGKVVVNTKYRIFGVHLKQL